MTVFDNIADDLRARPGKTRPSAPDFVTHDQEKAIELADLVVVISVDRMEQVGKRDDLRVRPKTQFVTEFFSA